MTTRKKRRKGAVDDASNLETLPEILGLTLSRKHTKLKWESSHNYQEIHDWLCTLLPDWKIHTPSVLGDKAFSAAWPSEKGDEMNKVKQEMKNLGIKDPDEYLAVASCQPYAIELARMVIECINEKKISPSMICDCAHTEVVKFFHDMDVEDSADLIFAQFVSGAQSVECYFLYDWQNVCGGDIWLDERFMLMEYDNIYEDLPNFLYGDPLVDETIKHFANYSESRRDHSGIWTCPIATLPLYVMSYLFSENEMEDEEINRRNEQMKDEENVSQKSAKYSCHVMGLVMDTETKNLYIADPNGALDTTSNSMEFLSMPLSCLENHTTSKSAFDRIDPNRK